MSTDSLSHFETAFASVGWFIPPYASMGFLSPLAAEILKRGSDFSQHDLERSLSSLYDTEGLAAMICSRYPITPVVCDYKDTISESIQAHFLDLHHVAVAGLIPVIEGAGRELLKQRGLSGRSVREVFSALASDCKQESTKNGIGASGDVCSMMDSFSSFTHNVLYVDSDAYPFLDGTNRHGITHGRYRDADYGSPINFYKTIGAVDFLAFVSAFRANISWLSPSPCAESRRLSTYYRALKVTSANLTRHDSVSKPGR